MSCSGPHGKIEAELGWKLHVSPPLALPSVTRAAWSRPCVPRGAACGRQRLWFQAEVNIDMTVFTLVTLLLLTATRPAPAYSQGGKGACGEEPREGEAHVSGSHSRGHVVRKLGTSPVRGHWRRGPGPVGQCRELGSWGSGQGSTGLGLSPSSATDWQWDSRTVGEWGGEDFTVKCCAKVKDNQYFSLASVQPQSAPDASGHCPGVPSRSSGGFPRKEVSAKLSGSLGLKPES